MPTGLIIILCCIGAFLLGIAVLYVGMKLSILFANKRKKRSRSTENATEKKKIGTMNLILIIIGILTLIFTVTMIWIFIVQGAVPDTLITCFFAFVSGEAGIMGWIKTSKEKAGKKTEEKAENKEAKG